MPAHSLAITGVCQKAQADNVSFQTAHERTEYMSELIVIGFQDTYRAAEVLNELRRREWDWVVDLDEAVVVRWGEEGKLRVQICVDPTTHEGALWARLWGSLLSLGLFIPDTHGVAAAAGNVAIGSGMATSVVEGAKDFASAAMPDGKWWKESLRISEEFVRDIGALIQPGDSAIFMLLRTPKVVSVLRQLRNYGGTLLRTSLSPEQENKVNAVFSCMGTEVRA
jgi:uncharacterized membrane protein